MLIGVALAVASLAWAVVSQKRLETRADSAKRARHLLVAAAVMALLIIGAVFLPLVAGWDKSGDGDALPALLAVAVAVGRLLTSPRLAC